MPVAVEMTPLEFAGRSFAIAATIIFAGSALANPLLGALAQWAGWNIFWLTTAGLGLLGTVLAASLPRNLSAGRHAGA